jgi:hypothetical protein
VARRIPPTAVNAGEEGEGAHLEVSMIWISKGWWGCDGIADGR